MLKFKTIRWKNFLSTGNSFTELQLNKSESTLITGHNGSGKSTLIDALSFGLFGKPHRGINKPQLINSINKKHMLVELEFDIGSNEYKIVRGMKPNKFEIWKDGVMLNQSAHNRDYQKILEQNILKLNHKSFHQVVVLGSSSYIPFMQLPAHHRRLVIEDLLDINIFTKMNMLLKEKMGKLKQEILDVDYNISILNEKVRIQRKYIEDLEEVDKNQVTKHQRQVKLLEKKISELQAENDKLTLKLDEDIINRINENKQQCAKDEASQSATIRTIQNDMQSLVKEAKFYEENDDCPICSQRITKTLKNKKAKACKHDAKKLHNEYTQLKEELKAIKEKHTSLDDQLHKLHELSITVRTNNHTISSLQEQINDLQTSTDNTKSKKDVKKAQSELERLTKDLNIQRDTLFEFKQESLYNMAIAEMLKDSGIKTKVIKQYLPIINKLVNNYLQVLDFFVSFNLDESFNEVIKSRHREAFNYASFSEGEKQRIDLAILFAWRQIARMKNSVATNLLILDEVLDASLDTDGVDNLFSIIRSFDKDTNLFIISHKQDVIDGTFNDKIVFKQEKNFSKCIKS